MQKQNGLKKMTDDIVTRLRKASFMLYPTKLGAFIEEAADVIEDYQADLKRHFDMITKQRCEIESLKSYIADLQAELCRLERENARHV